MNIAKKLSFFVILIIILLTANSKKVVAYYDYEYELTSYDINTLTDANLYKYYMYSKVLDCIALTVVGDVYG